MLDRLESGLGRVGLSWIESGRPPGGAERHHAFSSTAHPHTLFQLDGSCGQNADQAFSICLCLYLFVSLYLFFSLSFLAAANLGTCPRLFLLLRYLHMLFIPPFPFLLSSFLLSVCYSGIITCVLPFLILACTYSIPCLPLVCKSLRVAFTVLLHTCLCFCP